MAALQSHWKDDVVPWPFVRLARKVASVGKTSQAQKEQAILYLHYLLLARSDLQVAQGLLSSDKHVIFLLGIGGEGIQELEVEWKDEELDKLLYVFIYHLYNPGNFTDSTYSKPKFDEEATARYIITINCPRGMTECCGFYPIYSQNLFAMHTHILSNPNFKIEGNDLTILKDQYCQVKRCFEELTILNEYVHKPEHVPGMVVATYGKHIKSPYSKERCKHHLRLEESRSPFMSIPMLSKVLEMLFDILEGI